MNRATAILAGLVAVNAALLIAGAGRGGDDATGSQNVVDTSGGDAGVALPGTSVRVGLVFDVGGLGDQSFNDSANAGLEKARNELGVRTHYFEPRHDSDREFAMRQFANEGYDLIIGVGFIFSDDILTLAGKYPDVKFACIDYNHPRGKPGPPDNLVGLRFREHEGSFLVGAIAGLTTKSKQVGFVGGMKIPLIRKFEAGYYAGVKHVCPDCRVRAAYAGSTPQAFADSVKGRELAMAQYSRGVDIIYHASGKTGVGVFKAAVATGKLAIGVDSDQYHMAKGNVLTSMVKNVDVAVFETIARVVEERFEGGVRELGLAEGGVRYVRDDNNRDLLSEDVATRVEAIRQQVIAGSIQVPLE